MTNAIIFRNVQYDFIQIIGFRVIASNTKSMYIIYSTLSLIKTEIRIVLQRIQQVSINCVH